MTEAVIVSTGRMRPWYAFCRWLFRGFFRILFRIHADGTENIPLEGGLVLAANHASFLDPPAVGVTLPRGLTYLARDSLFRFPPFGALLRSVNAVPLDRTGADVRALRQAVRLVRKGRAIIVFPEGTRGDGETLGSPLPGVGMIALRAGAPVVPVYISGTAHALPRGARWPRPGRIRVTYGAPVELGDLAASSGPGRAGERYREAAEKVMGAIDSLRPCTGKQISLR